MVYTKKDCFIIKQYDGTISPKTLKAFGNPNTAAKVKKICNNKFKNSKCATTICETLATDPNMNPLTMKPFKQNEKNLKNKLISECQNYDPSDACSCIFSPSEKRKIIDACIKLSQNPNINPYTGRKIKIGSKTFNNLKYTCDICEKPINVDQVLQEAQPQQIIQNLPEPIPFQQSGGPQDCQQYIAQIDAMNVQIDQLLQSQQQQAMLIEELSQNINNKDSATLDQYQDKIDELLVEKEKLKGRLIRLNGILKFTSDFAKNLENTVKELQAELAESRRKGAPVDNKRLAQLEEMMQDYDDLQYKYDAILGRLDDLTSQYKSQSNLVDQLTGRLTRCEKIEKQNQVLEQKLSEYQELSDLKVKNLSQDYQDVLRANQETINKLKKENEFFLKRLTKYETEDIPQLNERIKNEIEKCKMEKDNLYEQMVDYREGMEFASGLIDRFQDQVNSLEGEKDDLSNDIQQLQDTYGDLQIKYDDLKFRYEGVIREYEELQGEMRNSGQELSSDQSEEYNLLKEYYDDLVKENDELTDKYNVALADLDQSRNMYFDLADEYEKYIDECEDIRQKYDTYTEKLEELQLKYEQQESELLDKEDLIQSIRLQKQQVENELQSLKQKYSPEQFEKFLQELDIEYNKKLSSERTKNLDTIQRLNRENEILIQELDSLRLSAGSNDERELIAETQELLKRITLLNSDITYLESEIQQLKLQKDKTEESFRKYEDMLYTILDKLNNITRNNQMGLDDISNPVEIIDRLDEIDRYILNLRTQNQSYDEYLAFGGEPNSRTETYEKALYAILRRLNEIIVENNLPVQPLTEISQILDGIDEISSIRNKPKNLENEIADLTRYLQQQNSRMGGSRLSRTSAPSFGADLPQQMSDLSNLVERTSKNIRNSK